MLTSAEHENFFFKTSRPDFFMMFPSPAYKQDDMQMAAKEETTQYWR